MYYLHKIILCYVGIILLTSIIFIIFKAKDRAEQVEQMKAVEAFQEGLEDPFKKIGDAFNKISDFFKQVDKFFKMIPVRFARLGRAFDGIGKGIGKGFENTFKSTGIAFEDIVEYLKRLSNDYFPYLGKMFSTYFIPRVVCTAEKIANIKYCSIYYSVELVLGMIHSVVVKLPTWLILNITGVDISPIIDFLGEIVMYIDTLIYENLGVHPFRWTDEVMQKCYWCKGIPDKPAYPENFTKIIKKMDTDFNVRIPKLMNEPSAIFKQVKKDFDIFFSGKE